MTKVNNNYEEFTPGYTMEIKTIQLSAFKTLIEALKEILKDATLKCTPIVYEANGEISPHSGLSIIEMNQSTSVLIRLKLSAKNFELYNIRSEKPILIGLNMLCLYKLIKTINSDDKILTLFLEENDMNHLGIKIENSDKNTCTIYKLNILDAPIQNLSIPRSEFDAIVTMPSIDFQKIIRDMSNISDSINITFVNDSNTKNKLIFSGQGDFAQQQTTLTVNNSSFHNIEINKCLLISGRYDLRNLGLFSKCSNLCQNIDLFMKKDFPLIIKYDIGNLGQVFLVITHKLNLENMNDVSEVENE